MLTLMVVPRRPASSGVSGVMVTCTAPSTWPSSGLSVVTSVTLPWMRVPSGVMRVAASPVSSCEVCALASLATAATSPEASVMVPVPTSAPTLTPMASTTAGR